jgi:hypothetical protein
MTAAPRPTRRGHAGAALAAALVAALTVIAGAAARSAAPPQNTREPSISGSPIVGKTLTGNRGTWSGANLSYTYSWLRCSGTGTNCAAITGATQTRYTLVSADLGATIRFRVTAANADGQARADSNNTAAVTTSGGKPASTSPPTVSGNPVVGATLTASTGAWVGDQPITYSYQWQNCDDAGNACSAINNATARTWNVLKAYVGRTIRVRVTAKNSRGTTNAFSAATGLVQDAGGGTGGSGVINLPNGGKSIDVADVPKGERLIVDKVVFSPSPVTSRSKPIVVKITVRDTRNYYVRNATVFIRSTPLVTSSGDHAKTATDGTISYQLQPEADFPIKNGYSVQFYVKAYRVGDPSLAGVSGTRLVQVATSTG